MMYTGTKRVAVALALVAILVAAAGCVRKPLPESLRIDTSPMQVETSSGSGGANTVRTDSQTFPLEGATDAKVDLSMGAGEMIVRGISAGTDLAQATFEVGPSMKPETAYEVSGSTGKLVVSQPDITWKFGTANPNSWDVGLNQEVPLDLSVHMGAGSSRLDLSKVEVRDLTMRLGAGETRVDLTGTRTQSVKGDVQAGVGELTILLPRDIGVKVTGAKNGVGDLKADGFTVQGDAYVNDAYGKTPVSIELNVVRGVGEVKLELQ